MRTPKSILLAAAICTIGILLFAACSEDDPVIPPVVTATGTVVIGCPDCQVPIPWSCVPPAGGTIAGEGDTTMVDMPLGEYTVAWNSDGIVGDIEPQTGTLEADSTLGFLAVIIPERPEPDPNRWFFDVAGTADDDVYAVGAAGNMVHFDGAGWSRVDLGVTSSLTSIVAEPGGSLWVCGHEGKVWRRSGTSWNEMDSGTTENLYALGWYQGVAHVGGHAGALRRLEGSTWSDVDTTIVIRDPGSGVPTDTLALDQDIVAVTTINHFGIGGAFLPPDYVGEPVGIEGTVGMVLGQDQVFDWRLTPIEAPGYGAPPSWVLCSTSDPVELSRNFLGTSVGSLYELVETVSGPTWHRTLWPITSEDRYGVRDMWLDPDGNLYLVTGGGRIVYRTQDGSLETLYDGLQPLTGIWGTGPDNFFVVGYMENLLLHCHHDPVTGSMEVIEVDMQALWENE